MDSYEYDVTDYLLKPVRLEELKSRMAAFSQTIKTSPMWDGSKEMLLPGELEHRTALHRKEKGIPLPAALADELAALGAEMGVSSQLA